MLYDKDSDQHYDIISAFIKSVRGSNPDGALYWLARMVEAGEDPLFIARRLVILAAEDVGLADPAALSMAVAGQQAVHFIGMPEGRIPLAPGHGVSCHVSQEQLRIRPPSTRLRRTYAARCSSPCPFTSATPLPGSCARKGMARGTSTPTTTPAIL